MVSGGQRWSVDVRHGDGIAIADFYVVKGFAALVTSEDGRVQSLKVAGVGFAIKKAGGHATIPNFRSHLSEAVMPGDDRLVSARGAIVKVIANNRVIVLLTISSRCLISQLFSRSPSCPWQLVQDILNT